jgi:hypothetical protein
VSKTDKDKPGRVKIAQGEPEPRGYVARCDFYAGRDAAWREEVKAQSGRDRTALRKAVRESLSEDPEDVDILPPPPKGTDWVVY